MRQNAHRNGPSGHFEAEAGGTVADIKPHAALQRAGNRAAQLTFWRQDAVRFAVIAVGNDVACAEPFGDFVEVRRVVADMHHQRQIAVFPLDGFRPLQRRNSVLADNAAAHARLQADDKIRVACDRLLHRIRVNVGHIGQLVLGNQPDAGDIEQRINVGSRFAGQLIKVIDIVCTGAPGINHGGDAGSNTDAVRLVMINR